MDRFFWDKAFYILMFCINMVFYVYVIIKVFTLVFYILFGWPKPKR